MDNINIFDVTIKKYNNGSYWIYFYRLYTRAGLSITQYEAERLSKQLVIDIQTD